MMEDGWTSTDIEEPEDTSLSTVGRHYESARPMADDGWTSTDIEEPAATSPSTVGRHSRSARPTANDGWTSTDIEEPAATSPSILSVDTTNQSDRRRRRLDADGRRTASRHITIYCR